MFRANEFAGAACLHGSNNAVGQPLPNAQCATCFATNVVALHDLCAARVTMRDLAAVCLSWSLIFAGRAASSGSFRRQDGVLPHSFPERLHLLLLLLLLWAPPARMRHTLLREQLDGLSSSASFATGCDVSIELTDCSRRSHHTSLGTPPVAATSQKEMHSSCRGRAAPWHA